MAAGDLTEGYRARDYTEFWSDKSRPCYWLLNTKTDDDFDASEEHPVVWLRLPDGASGRIHGGPDGWQITEHEDGTVTSSPSIFNSPPNGWHGYLEKGVFREV